MNTQATFASQLTVTADPGVFIEAELNSCDEPVRRYFRAAVVAGTPLARAAHLRMRGSIKLANRWIPFRSDELLAPLHGYHWPAPVAAGLLRGADVYGEGVGSMTWNLFGLIPVIRASGADVTRSAIGRAVAEGIWLPTALLPRYGVEWRAEDEDHLAADVPIAGEHVTLQITVGGDGLVRSAHMDRWGDPDGTGTFGWFPFGIEVGASRPFACGITMPAEGVGGWFHGMDRWHDGEFFRYTIDEVTLVSIARESHGASRSESSDLEAVVPRRRRDSGRGVCDGSATSTPQPGSDERGGRGQPSE